MLIACSGGSGNRSPFDDGSSSSSGGQDGPGFGGPNTGDAGKATAQCSPDPANFEVPNNGCDDDADGTIDNAPSCDDGLAATGSAEDFAKAIGLCQKASDTSWGLVSATFTRAYGSSSPGNDAQHGILPKFGTLQPREGKTLGVLSSGFAQEFDGKSQTPFAPGKSWGTPGTLPSGYPKPAPGCNIDKKAFDMITTKLVIKAPKNAAGIAFDFNFFTSEWPMFVCSNFNDGFLAVLTSKAFNGGVADNISFDAQGAPVSVNNGFFDRCTPDVTVGCRGSKQTTSKCGAGTAELGGTGFGILGDGCDSFGGTQNTLGGATGWLTSQTKIEGGETVTLELMIWDTGDAALDSSVLVDHLTWVQGDVQTGTERPPAVK